MEVFNILFESGEILKQKINDIEKRNIIALEQSNREIKELLAKVPTPKNIKLFMSMTTPIINTIVISLLIIE